MKIRLVLMALIALTVLLFAGCNAMVPAIRDLGNQEEKYTVTVSDTENVKLYVKLRGGKWQKSVTAESGDTVYIKEVCNDYFLSDNLLINGEPRFYYDRDGESEDGQYYFILLKNTIVSVGEREQKFTIRYDNCMDNPNTKTEFDHRDGVYHLEAPTKNGADFVGWIMAGTGEYVTELDLGNTREDIYLVAEWNEIFNLYYSSSGTNFGNYEILSLTEYGASKETVYVPDTYGEHKITWITSLTDDVDGPVKTKNIHIGKNVNRISDEAYEVIENIYPDPENGYFTLEGDILYSETTMVFVNNDYYEKGNDTLYIGKDVTDVDVFAGKGIENIKHFAVSSENTVIITEATEKYSPVGVGGGYTEGNVLFCNNVLRRLASHGDKKFILRSDTTRIGEYAVAYNDDIGVFYFGGNLVKTIDKKAFYMCRGLYRVAVEGRDFLPASVHYLEDYAFAGCHSLKYLSGGNLKSLGSYFIAETGIVEFRIPPTVEKEHYVDMLAFRYSNLLQIDNSSTHFELGYQRLYGINVINNPNISEYPGVNKIIKVDDFVFYRSIGNDVETIKLVSYTGLSDTVFLPHRPDFGEYVIATHFLYQDRQIKYVFLPNVNSSAVAIEENAFKDSPALIGIMLDIKNMRIADNVTIVSGCESFKYIYFEYFGSDIMIPVGIVDRDYEPIYKSAQKDPIPKEYMQWYRDYDARVVYIYDKTED